MSVDIRLPLVFYDFSFRALLCSLFNPGSMVKPPITQQPQKRRKTFVPLLQYPLLSSFRARFCATYLAFVHREVLPPTRIIFRINCVGTSMPSSFNSSTSMLCVEGSQQPRADRAKGGTIEDCLYLANAV